MSCCSYPMSNAYATYCGGSFAARMTSALLLIADIALAMSVVFFSVAFLAERLRILIVLAVIVSIIVIIATQPHLKRPKR